MAVGAPVPANISAFFDTPTPEAWLDAASERIPELLLDHANCELKAASTALGFLYRYPERTGLAQRMSRLAREELRHFEQVRAIMADMQVPFERLNASRYCERFARLAPRLPEGIAKFYTGLLVSESRHFEHYLGFARSETGVSQSELDERLVELLSIEAKLITEPDPQFRFHSGLPAGA
jgi:tRNA-(ms[2]io[6]A)-hydroxylase